MGARDILLSEPDLSGSLEPFRERLAETISWCQRRVALGNLPESLRSPATAPPPATPWPETLRAVAEARLRLLGRSWRRSLDPLGGGLLFVYFPLAAHSGGRAALASSGYLDQRDAPPWDTWVAYVQEARQSYVVAWAPPESFPFLTAAARVPHPSIQWLDSSGLALEGQLRVAQAG